MSSFIVAPGSVEPEPSRRVFFVELGSSAEDAIRAVRKARTNTIENWDQEEYVRRQRPVADDIPIDDPRKDRVEAMMLGPAIGDALGSTFEFLSSTSIAASIGSTVAREFYPAQSGSLMYARKPLSRPTIRQ